VVDRNRIAEIHGLLIEASTDLGSPYITARGWGERWHQLQGDVLMLVSEVVLEREEKSEWLKVTARTLFTERHQRGVRWDKPDSYEAFDPAEDEAHMRWLRAEIKARDDELIVMQDTIYCQQEQINQYIKALGRIEGNYGR
jgi:hypothetical protein